MRKIIALAVFAGVAQIACVYWIIHRIATLPIVEKIEAKIKRDVVEWSEEK